MQRLLLMFAVQLVLLASAFSAPVQEHSFAEVFDTHWQNLADEYPFFELYGVDWDAARELHRPLALAAADEDAFTWELARMFARLPDPHFAYLPDAARFAAEGRPWSYPELDVVRIGAQRFLASWPVSESGRVPEFLARDPHAFPEVVAVAGAPMSSAALVLAAGPLGSDVAITLRWPDGVERVHRFQRPEVSNFPPEQRYFGDEWLRVGRVGKLGYLRVHTFSPDRTSLDTVEQMSRALRSALHELRDTDALILDLRGNGGGRVRASDPFLGHFLRKTLRYQWGPDGEHWRTLRPKRPRYTGEVAVLVDETSGSGGEWAARILRDAERATLIGGRSLGAEAAVHHSKASDGSVVAYSAWALAGPEQASFQHVGLRVDHALPLTIDDLRSHGLTVALERLTRARLRKALDVLGAQDLDTQAFLELAGEAPVLTEAR